MWRPKFLFPELEIPDPPTRATSAPVGEIQFNSDDEEWDEEKDLNFGDEFGDDDYDEDVKENKDNDSRESWMNSVSNNSSASVYSCSTMSHEEALNDSQEFHADRGDLDFDMGERWKIALRESLDQPIYLDFDRTPRKESVRKLRKLGKKKGKKKNQPLRRKSESDLHV